MTERALVGDEGGCAKLNVTLTNQRYGDAPTVTWTATIAPNATEIVRPLTALRYPGPETGPHKIAETKPMPNDEKRESHHVPGKSLASSWAASLDELVTSISALDPAYAAQTSPWAEMLKVRAAAFRTANANDGSGLLAILIHQKTHRLGQTAVHKANTPPDSLRILAEINAEAETTRLRGGKILAANPQETHWRAFIEACYRKVVAGELQPMLDGEVLTQTMAEREVAQMALAFERGEDVLKKRLEKSKVDIHETIKTSIADALKQDVAKVKDALAHSTVDGTPDEHKKALTALGTDRELVWQAVKEPLT